MDAGEASAERVADEVDRSARFLLLWSAAITAAGMPLYRWQAAGNIEQSFQSALHVAVDRGMRFGSEIAFTYGPLGFLSFPQLYDQATTTLAIVFNLALGFAAALVTLAMLARHLRPILAVSVTYLVFVAGWGALLELEWIPEAAACLLAVCSVLLLHRIADDPDSAALRPTLAAALGAATSIVLLMKTSSGLQAGAVTLSTAWLASGLTLRPTRGHLKTIASWTGGWAGTLIVLWLATGQHIGDLATFGRQAIEFTSGYAAAMGHERPRLGGWEYWLAALSVAVVVSLAVRRWDLLSGSRRRLLLLIPIGLYVFVSFKAGFVRHDRHSVIFFATMPLVGLALSQRRDVGRALVFFVVSVAVLWAAAGSLRIGLVNPVPHLSRSLDIAHRLVSPGHLRSEISQARLEAQERYAIPQSTLARLEGTRVGIDPWDVAALWAHPELDWAAPPVFQTFAAYTTRLDDLNARFLRSSDAPDYILRAVKAIDGRSAAMVSPRYMIAMACRYGEIESIGVWHLLVHRGPSCGKPVELARTTIELGERVALPDPEQCAGWLTVSVHGVESAGQRLQATLFKYGHYWLEVGNERFRLVPGTAEQRHLLPVGDVPGWLAQPVDDPRSGITVSTSGIHLFPPDVVELRLACIPSA